MIMKEIIISAIAMLTIFGAPIIVMWITVLAELLEKPRWTIKHPLNISEPVPCMVRELNPKNRQER